MYKRKELIPDITSCNDPICSICIDESVSHLRPIGSTFKQYYNTYSIEGEGYFRGQDNVRSGFTEWKVIGYYKGKNGQMHEQLKDIS